MEAVFFYRYPLLWRLAYRFEKKQKTISFSPYPEVSLAEAREKRDDVKAKLRENTDPIASRQEENDPNALIFKEASEQYGEGRKDLTENYKKNGTNALKTHLFPMLRDKPIASITREMLMEPLKTMDGC